MGAHNYRGADWPCLHCLLLLFVSCPRNNEPRKNSCADCCQGGGKNYKKPIPNGFLHRHHNLVALNIPSTNPCLQQDAIDAAVPVRVLCRNFGYPAAVTVS